MHPAMGHGVGSPYAGFAPPMGFPRDQLKGALRQDDGEPPEYRNWTDSRTNPKDIRQDNIMDYFLNNENPFYDRTNCINSAVHAQLRNAMLPPEQIQAQMAQLSGIEYRLIHVNSPLFVIRKVHRNGPQNQVTLANYFIINGTVYQAPDLFSFVNAKIANALNGLHEAFGQTLRHLEYSSLKGYHWDFAQDSAAQAKLKTPQEKAAERLDFERKSSWFQRSRVDGLLMGIQQKFPMPPPPPQEGEEGVSQKRFKDGA